MTTIICILVFLWIESHLFKKTVVILKINEMDITLGVRAT